jgi:hypothetical protein
MPSIIRSLSGFLKAATFAGVADGTELNNLQNWKAFRAMGSADGLFRIESGEIESHDNVSFAMVLWGDPGVKSTGQCVRADVMSPDWATSVLGLCANGALDHSEDTRGFLGNSYELAERSGIGDYGEGFSIAAGTTPTQPLTNGSYYPLLVASVQNPGSGNHARGGIAFSTHALAFNDTNIGISTGINDGSNTYPGIYYFASPAMRWRNYKVYTDYRILLRGLTGTQAFRLLDAGGSPLLDSPTQSGNEAHVNAHLLTWPITGYLQVYTDNTFTTAVALLRFPAAGTASDINGGDVYDVSTMAEQAVQINLDDAPNPPDEWTVPSTKDVTLDVVDVDITSYTANPQIQQDTATFIFRDPFGKYVPARTNSALYPNVKEGKWIRWGGNPQRDYKMSFRGQDQRMAICGLPADDWRAPRAGRGCPRREPDSRVSANESHTGYVAARCARESRWRDRCDPVSAQPRARCNPGRRIGI